MAGRVQRKRLSWGRVRIEDLNRRLAQTLCLKQPCLNEPFFITSDANDLAVGAQLCQEFEGLRKPKALFSRKVTKQPVESS